MIDNKYGFLFYLFCCCCTMIDYELIIHQKIDESTFELFSLNKYYTRDDSDCRIFMKYILYKHEHCYRMN